MTKPWNEVANSAAFKALPGEQQDAARQQYFDAVVAPRVPEGDQAAAWDQFSSAAGYGSRVLPAGVEPSQAGGGRGFVQPPDAEDLTRPAGALRRSIERTLAAAPRQSVDERRTRSPGRVTDADIPDATAGSVARDIASGALQIGPTAVKSVADLARLATGDTVGKGLSDAMEGGMQSIREVVGSERAQLQRKRFQQDMADPALNGFDVIDGNPGALADQVLPTLGSMAVPVGAAALAGKAATAGRAAQVARAIDEATVLERADRARQAAGIGATVLQNAGDTFSTIRDAGGDLDQSYLGAAITAPATYVAGRVTGGGAEAAVARGMAGRGTAAGAIAVPRAMISEGAQEMGEQAGQSIGETVGKGAEFDANTIGKELAVAGTLGAAMGGGVNVAQQAPAMAERIARMRAGGEKAAADLLQRRLDQEQAAAAAPAELGRLREAAPDLPFHDAPDFQNDYTARRQAGTKPAEAAAWAGMTATMRQAAPQLGLSDKALAAALKKAEGMEIDQVPGFVERYARALASRGVIPPIAEGVSIEGVLGQVRDRTMTAAADASYPADSPRATMDAIAALEQAGATQGAIGSGADDGAATTRNLGLGDGSGTGAGAAAQVGPAGATGGAADAQPVTQPADGLRPGAGPAGADVRAALPGAGGAGESPAAVDPAVHAAATSPHNDLPEPTQAQKDAGNYKVGRMRIAGMDLSIENPEGSVRRGTAPDGTAWETPMRHHYGYIRGTTATDGDKLDVFVVPGTAEDFDGPVFVVDQVDPDTGKLDEHKVILGAKDAADAEAIYRANYTADWQGFGAMTSMPMGAFQAWAKSGSKKRPLGRLPDRAAAEIQTLAPDQLLQVARGEPGPWADAAAAELKRRETDYMYRQRAEDVAAMRDADARPLLDEARDQQIAQADAIDAAQRLDAPTAMQLAMQQAKPLKSRPAAVTSANLAPALASPALPAAENVAQTPAAPAAAPAAPAAPQFTYKKQTDGTLRITGDAKAIRAQLAEFGIGKTMPARGGVIVGKSQAARARDALDLLAKPAVQPTGPVRDVEIEKTRAANAAVNAAFTGDAAPALAPEEAARQRQESAAAKRAQGASAAGSRAAARAANPMRAFLGQHGISLAVSKDFAPGRAELRSAMVQGFGPVFRRAGLPLDQLAERAVEEGFLLEPDVPELESLISRALAGERIIPQFAEGVAETEMAARIARERQFEEDAAAAARETMDDDLDVVLDAIESNTSEDDFLRALGASEEEIEDARREREARAARGAGVEAGEAATGEAPRGAEGGAAQTGPDGTEGRDDPLTSAAPADPAPSMEVAAPLAAAPAARAKPSIVDAGEKIGGARKDRWKDRGLDLSDLDAMSEGEGAELATKANVWKPDWKAIVDGGMDAASAATAKVIYDRLAAQPKDNTPAGRRRYVRAMQAVRRIYSSLTPENLADANQRLLYDELGWTEGRSPKTNDRARANAAGVEDLAAHMREARAVLFSVYKGRSDPFYLNGTDLRKIRQMLADGFPAKAPAWTRRFVVAEEGGPGLTPRGIEIAMQEAAAAGTPIDADTARAGYFVVRSKLSRKTLAAAATKADAEAAAAVLHEKAGKSAAGAGGPAEPQRPHLDALLRAGLAQRLDRDATAEDFVQDFGFRGIEFGNWSAQDERQRIINMAYDGLADLAELMGVPLKAMSLNGTMGLAFGARGGGRFAAHYEPGRLVINMTKIRGGGSMAHEWAHALDHYFGELDRGDAYQGRARGASGWNDEGDYSGKPRTRMVRDGADWKKVAETRLANLRPEMAAAFDRVMSALFQGQVGKAVMVRDAEQRLERAEARAAGESDPALAAMYREGASSARAELERLRQDPDDKQYPRGRTEFAGEAAKLSGGNSDGYWLRPTEMFARAFESWVFDRLAAMGARSDYLVHGVESDRFAGGAFKGNPYPVGPERARINEAFDALAASIQTRQTEKGVAMFARGGKAAPDTETFRRSGAPSSAMVAAAQARVEELTRGWKNGPRVSVVETPADLPVDAPPDVRGYYDGRGGIYIVAGTQPLSQIAETLAHEAVAHAGLRGLLGRDGWRQFVNTMQLALKTGNVPLRQLQAKVRAAYVDDDGRFNLSPAQEVDEIAALAVERGVDPTTGQFRPGFSWLKSLWAKAAQYLRGIGIDVPFTMSELHGMLAAAAQHLREGSADGRGAGMVPSAAARASGLGADRAYARGDAQAEPLPTAIVGDTLGSMNRLPDYPAAKAGNLDAAERVARSVVTAELAKKVRAAIGDSQPLVVPVVAEEAAGRNKIPRAAAEVLAARMGLTAVRGIAQANHARRTSLDGLARIFAPVEFTGRVEAGRDYLLLDDTLTQGGTFAALADHIRQGGGRVVGVVALTGKQYSATLAPSAETLQKLRDQHGDLEQDFRAATGYGYGHLTQSEARYLASFKPADALRARIVEEGRRARERGNAPAAGGQPPDVEGGAFARGPGAATAPVQAGPDWESMEPGWTDRVIYEAQDSRIDLKRTQEAIAAAGRNIDERFDARLAETLYPGRVARRSQQFLESEVKPLLESMARNKVSMDELADYLHARGAAERNAQIAKVNPKMPDGGAGTNTEGVLMTNAAAAAHLAKIVPLRRAVLDSLARKVDAITGGTRRLLVTEGLEKQETIDAWEAAYKHYVPMFRDEAASGAPHPQGSGFSVRGGSAKRATGSTKEVTNILAHVLMQREAAITRAEKNRVGLSLYGLALANPNPDFWTTIRPGMAAAQIASELTTMGVDPVVAEAGMQGVPTIRTVDPITNKVVDRPNPIYKSMPGAITLKVNGEDRVLLLNERDPRALRMAESLKNLDGLTRFDLAGSIIGKTTRWMAAVNTQFNPVFGVVNAVRDLQGGVINLTSTPLRGRQAKVFWNAGAAAAAVWREESGGKSSKWGALYRQFQEDGGQTGFRDMFRDANDRAKAIEKELAGLGKSRLAPGRAAHAVLDVLDVFNTTTENAVRLSAYAAALDEGMSRPAAARLARELTVDFNRKGRTGREAGPLYAFLNASVQGTERTVRALKGPAGRRIIAGGLALGMMQALLLAWAGYDEDEIPEFTKTRALVIPLSRNGEEKRYITIPLALGLHVLPNTGRIITELAIGDRRKIREKLTSAVGELAGAFNPLGGGNVLTADGLLRTALPTVADPIVELGFNKDFAGRPIEREAFDGEKDQRPGFSRAREGTLRSATGQVYTGLSKAINTVTGGSPYEAGGLSPTPERLRYLAQLAGGGVLREAEKLVNVSVAAAAGDPIKPGAVPLTSRFYGMVDADAVERARYFEAGRRIDQAESSLKAAQKAGDAEAMMRIMDAHPEVALAKAQAAVQREIGKLNKLAVTTIGDREQSQLIDAARVARMRALNDSVRALEEAAAGKPTLAQRLRGGVWRAEDVAAAQP